MFDAGLTIESLRDCLAGLPPVELKGMALLRERRPHGQFFPQLDDAGNLEISDFPTAERQELRRVDGSARHHHRLDFLSQVPKRAILLEAALIKLRKHQVINECPFRDEFYLHIKSFCSL